MSGNFKSRGLRPSERGNSRFPSNQDNWDRSKTSLSNAKLDPFAGKAEIPEETLNKYKRADRIDLRGIRTEFKRKEFVKKGARVESAVQQAARAELLLVEEGGFIKADENEHTIRLKQRELAEAVDIASATKYFDLNLPLFGPYVLDYSRNGRHLAITGKKGHVATMDWMTKKLLCEINVMEESLCVRWLHQETMFAVAQKEWVYVYDNNGVELHCLKRLHRVLNMEFLPYHFLLATSNESGFLSWVDVSVGQMVSNFSTRMGRLNIMTKNPYNGVLVLGHPQGVISMWSPNQKEPLVKMLCHQKPVRSVAIEPSGMYMATAGADHKLRVWDIRNTFESVYTYKLKSGTTKLSFSQKGTLARSVDGVVELYNDICKKPVNGPFLRHFCDGSIVSTQFCPYEDVLGIGHHKGFTSILVPGSGEPNFDAFEANPYQTKKQRKEAEVKMLLEKVRPEMIALNPHKVTEVNVPSLQEKIEATKKLMFVKPPRIEFSMQKGRGGQSTTKIAKTKKVLQDEATRRFIREQNSSRKRQYQPKVGVAYAPESAGVLDRFKPRRK